MRGRPSVFLLEKAGEVFFQLKMGEADKAPS